MKRNVPSPGGARVSLLPAMQWTLADIRQYLADHRENGTHCPACEQFVKVYRRKLYSTQARTLIYADRLYGSEYFHLSVLDGQPQLGVRQADFPKLQYWGLIEMHPARPEWRITDRGRAFLRDRHKVPERIVLYDGDPLGFEGRMVGIRDVLGTKFNYEELMST